MLFGGMAHRRAATVSRQVDDLGDALEAVEEHLREAVPPEPASRPERPPVPGMPLPTGYGLQVRGPDDERIVLPVCLPPGFELSSMVLCPEFLPRDEPRVPATRPAAPAAPARQPAPVRQPAAATPLRERLSGTHQYVFGSDPGFSMDETFGGAVSADPPRPSRAGGVETHRL